MRTVLLVVTHLAALAAGFALGIYTLPILTAPPAPPAAAIAAVGERAAFRGDFRRDLAGSDVLHWGEGALFVSPRTIAFMGRLAPGPDYRLYLAPEWVETRADFLGLKERAVEIAPVTTFDNFLVEVPDGIDVAAYDTAVVWCESFAQFISAARYR